MLAEPGQNAMPRFCLALMKPAGDVLVCPDVRISQELMLAARKRSPHIEGEHRHPHRRDKTVSPMQIGPARTFRSVNRGPGKTTVGILYDRHRASLQ